MATENHLITSEAAEEFRKSISNIISASETKTLSDEEQKMSDTLDSKFQIQKNKKSTMWRRITEQFFSQQADFQLKELEEYVRKKVSESNPARNSEEI